MDKYSKAPFKEPFQKTQYQINNVLGKNQIPWLLAPSLSTFCFSDCGENIQSSKEDNQQWKNDLNQALLQQQKENKEDNDKIHKSIESLRAEQRRANEQRRAEQQQKRYIKLEKLICHDQQDTDVYMVNDYPILKIDGIEIRPIPKSMTHGNKTNRFSSNKILIKRGETKYMSLYEEDPSNDDLLSPSSIAIK